MRHPLLLLLSCFLLLTLSAESNAVDDEMLYPVNRGYAEIDESLGVARTQAVHSNKLLMVVLGADWCHDSRAFIDHLRDPEFEALIAERYVVERVNVGYYDYVRGVVDRWDIPIIYGTPTVIVVEPGTDTVLNRDSLAHWRNAAALEPEDAVTYFEKYHAGPPPTPDIPSPVLAEALGDIERFERTQAERIYDAYAELGAEMKALGDERPGPDFLERWDNLAAMRGEITVDLEKLRAQARAEDAAGATDISLAFPAYELFID